MANRFLNNIRINDEYTLPAADGTADQVLTTDGAGQLVFVNQDTITSGSAERVSILVKNGEGTALVKGDPVYIIGSVGASNRLEVGLCDASDPDKMPCVGLLEQNLAINGEGNAVTAGKLRNLITTPIDGQTTTENETIYVKAGGSSGSALTTTKPTGSTNLIQNVGQVGRVSTSADGNFVVSAIMRTNDVPNLPTGKIWVGDGNTTTSTVVFLDEPNGRMGIGTTNPLEELHIASTSPGMRLQDSDGTDTFGRVHYSGSSLYFYSRNNTSNGNYIWIGSNGTTDTEFMRINSSGNVGIGTSSPSKTLHVSSANDAPVRVQSTDATTGIEFKDSDGDNQLYYVGSGDYFYTSASLGIGTTSPTATLHVESANDTLLRLKSTDNKAIIALSDNDTNGYISSENDRLSLGANTGVNANNLNIVLSSNNVGIGTTSPTVKLDVRGTMLVSGDTPDARIGSTLEVYRNGSTAELSIHQDDASASSTFSQLRFRNGGNDTYLKVPPQGQGLIIDTENKANALVISTFGDLGIGNTSPTQILHVTGNARVTGAYYDSNNSAGTSGQVLSSTATGTSWVGGSGLPGGPYLPLAGGTMTGNLKLNDNVQLQVGSSADLQILHDASDSFLINNTGDLYLRNLADDKDIIFQSDDGSGGVATYIYIDGSGERTIFEKNTRHDDNIYAAFGSDSDLRIYHDGTNNYIRQASGTGDLIIEQAIDDKDIIFKSDDGSGGVENYIQIDGSAGRTLFNKNIRVNDNVQVQVGNSADLLIYHEGTDSIIQNYTGSIYIDNNADDQDITFRCDNGSGGLATYFRIDGSQVENTFLKNTRHFDNVKAYFGDSGDLQIYHDGSNSYIDETGTGSLYIKSASAIRLQSATGENMIYAQNDAGVTLYHNNINKLTTTSAGVTVTGTATATTFSGDLNGTINTATTAVTKPNATNDTTVATTAFVQNLIGTIPAGLVFQGTWNAATNTPTLSSGSGTTGHFYIVSTDGSTNLDGITDWKVGDWAVFVEQGATDAWEKVDNSSVLDGSGTGQTVALWSGSGTSNTLTDAPITVSGNNTTFAGSVHLDNDSSQLQFGDDNDMQIYHNGAGGEINNTVGSFIIDSAGDINLDADGGDIRLYDGGVLYGNLANGAGHLQIKNPTQDMNISFVGNDGGSNVTALTLDMSEGGNATFAGTIDSKAITALAKGAQLGTSGYYINSTFKDTGDNVGVFLAHNDTANGTGAIAGINQLAFLTYGSAWTQALLLDSNQNATFAGDVGIGVSPSQPLDVNGTALIRNTIYVGDDIQHWGDGGTGMFFGTDTISLKNDGGSTRLFVKSGGNVGIGTTNPQNLLHLGDNTSSKAGTIRIDSFVANQFWKIEPGTNTLNIKDYDGTSLVSFNGASNYVLFNGGNVGIGMTSPNYKLDVVGNVRIQSSNEQQIRFVHYQGTGDEFSIEHDTSGIYFYNRTDSTGMFRIDNDGGIRLPQYGSGTHTGTATQRLGVDSSGNVIEIPIGSGAVDGSGAANKVAFWTDADTISSEDSFTYDAANNRLGVNVSSPSHKLHVSSGNGDTDNTAFISHTRNDSDVSTQALKIDANFSGADTTTADRNNAGLYIDLDSSADGDAADEVRSYGVWVDARTTGYNDVLTGGYFTVESNNTTEKTAQITGVYGHATHDSSSTNGGVSNMYGARGICAIQDYGDVDNSYAVHGLIQIANNRNANVDTTTALYGEIQIDEATELTYGNMYGVRSVIDNNEGSVPDFTNQYLFFGDYQGTRATGAYGIYVEGDRHYLAGNLGIDGTNPESKLTVGGNAITTILPTAAITDTTNGGSLTLRGQSPILSFDCTNSGTGKILMDSAGIEFKTGHLDSEGTVAFSLDTSSNATFAGNVTTTGVAYTDYIQTRTGTFIDFRHQDASTIMRIDTDDARVGIGTTSPQAKLVVADDNGAGLEIIPQTSNDRTTLLSYDRNSTTYQTIDFDGSDIHFNISGSEKARIDSSGNVGIGTTTPDSILTLQGNEINNQVTTYLHLNSGNNDSYPFLASLNSATISSANYGWTFINSSTNGNLEIGRRNNSTTSSTSLTIERSTGNVGIGTPSPDALLRIDQNANATAFKVTGGGSGLAIAEFLRDVGATASVRIHASNAHPTVQMASANNTFSLGVNNTSFQICDNDNLTANARLVIDSNGNVGIGTTSPGSELEVDGEITTTTLTYPEPGALDSSAYNGEIVYFGTQISMTEGKLMVLSTSAGGLTWYLAKDSTTSLATGMLGIALGTAASDGVLVRGIAKNSAWSSFSEGEKLYLSPTGGSISNSITSDTNDFVRIVGYALGGSKIYFCPDNTYIQNS